MWRACWLSLTVGAISSCGFGPRGVPPGPLKVSIAEPVADASILPAATFDFVARAVVAGDWVGVERIELHAGGPGVTDVLLTTCTPSAPDSLLSCEFSFDVSRHTMLFVSGSLNLTAVAVDSRGETASTSLRVSDSPRPLTVKFTYPPVTLGTNSLAASVEGTGPLEVSVTPVATTVVVTVDGNTVLQQWSAAPFSAYVDWSQLGAGPHQMTASATDGWGTTASAELDVVVACQDDADCSGSPGTVCSPQDGLCH